MGLLSGLALFSCVKEPILTVSVDRDIFGFAGGSGKLTLSANNEWSVSSSESWLKVVDEQGTASEKATARFTVAANDTPNKRTATITVSSSTLTQAITITQEQHDRISVEGPQAVGPQENTIVFTVSTNATYTIDVAEGSSWITHVDSKALDQHYESFSITANDTYGDRNGRIVFRTPGGEVAVADFLQSQNDAAFLEGQADYTFDYHGGSLTISAKSNVGCTAHIIHGGEWIHAQNTKALVDYAFSFSLDENPTFEDRTGIIRLETAGGDAVEEVTVLQTGKPEPYLTVQTNEVQMESRAGVFEITVSSNADIKLLPPDVDWLAASLKEESPSAMIETVLHVEVKENTGDQSRETTLILQTLEGGLEARVHVIQDYDENFTPFLIVDTEAILLDAPAVEIDVPISSNAAVEMLPVGVDWLKSTLLEVPLRLHIQVEENLLVSYRDASINLLARANEKDVRASVQIVQKCYYDGLRQFTFTHYSNFVMAPLISPSDNIFGIIDWGDSNAEHYAPCLEHSYTLEPPFTVVVRIQDVDEVTFPSIAGITYFDFQGL